MNHPVMRRSSAIFLFCQVISVSLWSLVPVWMNGNNRSVHLCWNESCKCERSWIVWRRSPGTRKAKPLRWRSCVQNLPPCRNAWTRWNGKYGVIQNRLDFEDYIGPNLSKTFTEKIHNHMFLWLRNTLEHFEARWMYQLIPSGWNWCCGMSWNALVCAWASRRSMIVWPSAPPKPVIWTGWSISSHFWPQNDTSLKSWALDEILQILQCKFQSSVRNQFFLTLQTVQISQWSSSNCLFFLISVDLEANGRYETSSSRFE